ncbi:hypothetical protein Y1Q_0002408 [Alligator mississippiensis]|uniref:Uncharacterized protein n=1 Tax=Alligator mississippiensis TaxID=8496 RepID=A0A151N676_ALLMI|nr:hypothetical protein Y1Q_0002408 [Alligator mississippiensis]
MRMSEMEGYYKKAVEDMKEEMAGIIRKRMGWHSLFRGGTPEENNSNDDGNDDDNDSGDDKEEASSDNSND